MSDLQKEVRTLALRQPRYFDDRPWPTRVALIGWAAVLAALAIVGDQFGDPRPWANTGVQLLAIAGALAAALWVVATTGRQRAERIKLSLVLSLAGHSALAIALHHYQLQFQRDVSEPSPLAIVEQRVEAIDVPPDVIVQPPPLDEERREIEKPVATGIPQLRSQELAESRTEPAALEAIRLSQVLPEIQPEAGPSLARAERPEPVPALRATTPGERSRRETSTAETSATAAAAIAQSMPTPPHRASRATPSTEVARLARAMPNVPTSIQPAESSPDQPPANPLRLLPRPASTPETPPEQLATRSRPREAAERADIAERRIEAAHSSAPEQRPIARSQPLRSELERSSVAAPLLTSAQTEAIPHEFRESSSAKLPRRTLAEVLPEVARDLRPTQEARQVQVAAMPQVEATTDQLAELTATRSETVSDAQPANTQIARQATPSPTELVELPSLTEAASSPRPTTAATPTRVANAEVPSIQPERSDATRSRQPGWAADVATLGTEQVRDVPKAPSALGQGGGRPVSSGRQAATESVSLSRSAAAVALGETRVDGAASTTVAGQLTAQQLPQRQNSDALPGLQSGGALVGQPSSGRTPRLTSAAALATEATLPVSETSSSLESNASEQPSGSERTLAASDAVGAVPRESSAAVPSDIIGGSGSFANEPAATEISPLADDRPDVGQQHAAVDRVAQDVRDRRGDLPVADLAAADQAAVLPPIASSGEEATASQSSAQPVTNSRASNSDLVRSELAVPVAVDAAIGDGGLGPAPSSAIGLPDRRASPRAELAHTVPPRLIERRESAAAGISGAAKVPAAAFSRRGKRLDELQAGGAGRPSAKTEAAIELGLEFLARAQLSDGRWSFAHLGENVNNSNEQPSLRADAAATGLALLAFLGAGYDHFDDKYQTVVDRGLRYLVGVQADNGELFPEGGPAQGSVTRFYGHGIASLALCEAFGMTGDAELREPAQRALDYIATTQHSERGGWRYVPGVNSDLSVTGWQLMALRSGQLAGLTVSAETFAGVRRMVDACRDQRDQRVLFRYNPWASTSDPRTRHGRQPSTVMTAVGLLTELYLGSNRDTPTMQGGANHLLRNLPSQGASRRLAMTGTLENPLRDTYYWYYATQVMFHMGGEYWTAWNDSLHPLVVDTQVPAGSYAGSWNPSQPVPDKWGAHGGRLYVTTMNLLSLEVYYRHLPLYEMTAQ